MRSVRSWAGTALVLAGLASGCASRSPFSQDFVEVRTPNFIVTSSLGEEPTLALARQLEFLHTGVLVELELPAEAPALPPTRVLAFDGRSMGRPFAVRAETAYLMPTIDGPLLVFRAAGSFDERASPDLRHRYAHRVLRDRARTAAPLWYEEGVAWLASTIQARGRGVRIGALVPEFRRAILDWRYEDLTSDFWRSDLSEETKKKREDFSARAWAVSHTLGFADGAVTKQNTPFSLFRRAVAFGDAGDVREALGKLGLGRRSLTERVYEHLENDRIQVRQITVQGWDSEAIEVVPLPPAESRSRLGLLAVDLGKPAVALDYLERALAADDEHARARAGMAQAVALDERYDEIEPWARSAVEAGESDPEVQLRIAVACRLAGQRDPRTDRRSGWLEGARKHYVRALELDRRNARARVGMAAVMLAEGADPEAVRPWLDAARTLRPGSLEVELWQARLDAAAGAEVAAEMRARTVASRSHWPALERAARELIDEIGAEAR